MPSRSAALSPMDMTAIDALPVKVHASDRLVVLDSYGILDTPPEQGFDDIVQLACDLCEAPVALVSIVTGNRQWFKARSGFPACQTDLDASVCAHVLAEPDLLVIPDLTQDLRTRANPLVTDDPHIRFYAGAPLRSSEGEVLGSLCVIDHKPRPEGLTDRQARSLRALAGQVMAQLELRRSHLAQKRVLDQREALIRTQATIATAHGDLDKILHALVEGVLTVMPHAEGAVIEMREDEELVYRATAGTLTDKAGLRLPLHGSIAGSCLLSGEPLLVPDVLDDARVKRDLVEELRLSSCILAPVLRGEEVAGVLKLQSSRPHAFASDDLVVAQVFAGTVSSGLAQAGEVEARRETRRSERRRQAIFDSAHDYAIVVMNLDGNVTDWNDGATKILGWTPAEMCGKPADIFFTPEDRAADIPAQEMYSAVTEGRGLDERWHLRKDGSRFWANGEMMALREEDGRHIGFVKILRDRTEQREGFARLQESRNRYRLVTRATNDVIWDWDFATDDILWNEALTTAYGHVTDAESGTGAWWKAHIHPDDVERVRSGIYAVIDGGGTAWTDEYRFMRADDSFADVLDRGYVIRDAEGHATRMIGAMLDLTERKRAEDALRDSERRLGLERGLLHAVFQQAPVGISIAGATGEVASSLNAKAEEMLGHGLGTAGDARYVSYGALHPDGTRYEPADYPTIRALRQGETVRDEEMRYRNPVNGEVRRLEVSSGPVRDADGAIQAAVTILVDVEEHRRGEERQELLNHELSHRMKNILAMVQAIAAQTLRGATDISAVGEALGNRLIALGKAHDVLLGGAAERAPLAAVVREGVGVQDEASGRVLYSGPDVEIDGKAALSLALMMHELTTNAVKYGALSVPEGRVDLTWHLLEAAEGPLLRIVWGERGGPPVMAPRRKGFGSRLIERGLSGQVGGTLSLTYPVEGVACVVEAPLRNFQAE